MITRTYTWLCILNIASATNVTQPLASLKKTTTLLYVYVSNFFKKDISMYPYPNLFTNNQATIHDLVLLSNIYNDIDIYQKNPIVVYDGNNLYMILYSKNCKCCKYHPTSHK